MDQRLWYSPDPRFWWWGVLGLYAIAFVAGLIVAWPLDVLTLLGGAVGALPLVGMAGYLLQRPIAGRWLWIGCFWVNATWVLWFVVEAVIWVAPVDTLAILLVLLLSLLVYSPILVSLWAYAYRSLDVWYPNAHGAQLCVQADHR